MDKHEQCGRDALATGRAISAANHPAQPAISFHFAKILFVSDLG